MKRSELVLFAKLCAISRLDGKKAIIPFSKLGFRVVKFFDNDGAQGFLVNNKEYNVLIFRGTEGDELSDIISDLEISKTNEYSREGFHIEPIGKVHYGFKKELDKIWLDIFGSIQNISGKLYITGHSLGGAMATIAASRLYPELLITFGSPRVGDRGFVDSLEVLHYRVQNNNDPVTGVPLPIHGYRHHGINIYMDDSGNIVKRNMLKEFGKTLLRLITFKDHITELVSDHFIDNYVTQLESKDDQEIKENTP